MQGQLSEIDIRSILQLIELGQRTGELFVEAYSLPSSLIGSERTGRFSKGALRESPVGQSWFVFFLNGQIIYATVDPDSNRKSRLRDYLRRYRKESALDNLEKPAVRLSGIAATNAPEYGYLWALLENHLLTPAQGRSIIQSMVHETLFDLLSLHSGAFIFELSPALAPQLMTLEIGSLVAQIMQQVQEWKQFHPHIQSPDQCPVLSNEAKVRENFNANTLKTLDRWVDGQTSIRKIARHLHKDVLTVARAIYPYIQQGLVQLVYPASETPSGKREWMRAQEETRVPRIVCIDDGVALCKAVEYILKQQGYEVAAISNPIKALSLVFQLKPDLILCDIAMPELDGYEICAMLRRATLFRQTPIVMLTGKDGFIDRVKARMVGATDYLTKPFGEGELLMILEKYIGPGSRDYSLPNQLLDDALATELELEMR